MGAIVIARKAGIAPSKKNVSMYWKVYLKNTIGWFCIIEQWTKCEKCKDIDSIVIRAVEISARQ